RDDGGKHREKITFSYENDDFILGVYTNSTYMGSHDTLFNRTTEIEKTLKIANQRTIKKYAFSPGGIAAQAWLSGGPQTVGNSINPLYEFDLYANEADATPTKPWLTMGVNNFDKKTRYSEAQMIEIWDRLVNSLRYK
uniref:T6SS immunity protein Tli4 family protein n=1 Tax=Rosenbergiella nectarea TaxID=988801 RepID=UPI001F4EEFAF